MAVQTRFQIIQQGIIARDTRILKEIARRKAKGIPFARSFEVAADNIRSQRVRQAERVAETVKRAAKKVFSTVKDLDNGSFVKNKVVEIFGSKKRRREEKNLILMIVGIGLAAVVVLLLIFKK